MVRAMAGHGARARPSRLRISDEDRHKVAEVLRQAAGEGRIDLDELDERLEATYAAKTYGELVPITADLPGRRRRARHPRRPPRPVAPSGSRPGPRYSGSRGGDVGDQAGRRRGWSRTTTPRSR